jgi:arginyl-tRNA synthetase
MALAIQRISVATIKYGMLNHDTAKDIVFELKQWAETTGMTGPYCLYAYARIQSIVRDVPCPAEAKVDYALLTSAEERAVLGMLHKLWRVIEQCYAQYSPSTLCEYVFDLSKTFSSFYQSTSVKGSAPDLKATRLEFIKAVGAAIKLCLSLLGIETIEKM